MSSADFRIAIVAARFNERFVGQLLEGALAALERMGTSREDVRVVRVPGAFELPLAAKRLAESGGYDAIIALGSVIRGETSHFEHVSRAAADGLERVSLDYGIPVGFGVLTTETPEQAAARAGGDKGNIGFDAAMAAVEMASVLRDIQ
jgi:6,7-dimethyl-8-ribityllumazine synthase